MINKFLMAGVGAVLATSAASAADLPSRRAPPVYVPPVIAIPYSWTGVEFGTTTSYSFKGSKSASITPIGGLYGQPSSVDLSKSGLDTVGGGVAANYQFTPGSGIVVGGAVDVNYLNLRKYAATGVLGGIGGNVQERVGYLATVNGRLGYAFDHFLVYGIGGFTFAGLHTSAALYSFGNPVSYNGTNNSTKTGYDYGGGLEYAIPTDSFLNYLSVEKILGFDKKLGLDIFSPTIKAEFVHYDLGSRTVFATGGDAAGGGYLVRYRTQGNLVRFGLGYKFGGVPSAAPVVARY